ncbi:GNAT family N-acetyltransferase [Streptomyces aureoversilis]|uniref:GNAT family N-acetyltransferase n=1 Tax=Streptomyces aureoversilis TaxID=67277 RepID=A0ABV9ZQ02_9ACTN
MAPKGPQSAAEEQARIEILDPTQWPLLRELRLRSLSHTGTLLDGVREAEAALPPSHWQELLATSVFWQAGVDDSPVGTARYTPQAGYGHGGSLWVDPQGRTRGLARRLMLTMIDHSRRRGDSDLRGQVIPANRPAVRLFRSVGAVPTGWLKPRTNPPHILRIEMSIPL